MIDPLKGIGGAIPKDLFPRHFNVCRQRVRGTTIERTAFSTTGKDDFRVPEKFAKLWGKGEVRHVTVSAVAQWRLQNAVTDNIPACQ